MNIPFIKYKAELLGITPDQMAKGTDYSCVSSFWRGVRNKSISLNRMGKLIKLLKMDREIGELFELNRKDLEIEMEVK